jgi:hypothetical protein
MHIKNDSLKVLMFKDSKKPLKQNMGKCASSYIWYSSKQYLVHKSLTRFF